MKRIRKGSEPTALTEWKALANDAWQPSWDKFSGSPKRATHRQLLQEQGYVCCYCGQQIKAPEDRGTAVETSHIEHLHPRSTHEDLRLDYGNMLASCLGKVPKGAPLHCGQQKGSWFTENMVHPLRDDCESRLIYTADGRVHPADATDSAASETIQHLALDIGKLRKLRAAEIDAFLEPVLADEVEIEVLTEQLEKLAEMDRDGRYAPFYFAVIQVLHGFLPA